MGFDWGNLGSVVTGGMPLGTEGQNMFGGNDNKPSAPAAAPANEPQSPGGVHIPASGATYPGYADSAATDPIVSAGYGGLLSRLQNLYDYPEGRKRALMAKTEGAYGAGEQRMRGKRSAYGGEPVGVHAKGSQQAELERSAGMADQMREWEDFIAQFGDEGLRTILMPFMQMLTQTYGIGKGAATSKEMQADAEPSDWEKGLGFLGDILG